jgi:hypothetical protein
MTRLLTAVFAILALALGACERHPLPGQTQVTHTHGSNGAHAEHHEGHDAHGAADSQAAPAPHGEKKTEASHTTGSGGHEEKPTFFPEKK